MSQFILILTIISSLQTLFLFAKDDPVKVRGDFFKEDLLVITLEHEDKWHTYWKNPGESGLASEFSFYQAGQEIKLAPKAWPTPLRYLEAGDILAYGYEGITHFFFEIPKKILTQLKKNFKLETRITYLVCKDICIPGRKSLLFDRPTPLSQKQLTQFQNALDQLPQEISSDQIEVSLSKLSDNKLILISKLGLDQKMSDRGISYFKDYYKKRSLITPYPREAYSFKREELYLDSQGKNLMSFIFIDFDGEYLEPIQTLPAIGPLKEKIDLKLLVQTPVKQTHGIITTGLSRLGKENLDSLKLFGEELKNLRPGEPSQIQGLSNSENLKDKNTSLGALEDTSLWLIMLFAFIGGLILNFMPCVLPVISLKLFGLIKSSHDSKSTLIRHNFFYTLGVLTSMWTLAAIVFFLKSSGQALGWGFQLQSPLFVFFMTLLMFILALSLLGLFDVNIGKLNQVATLRSQKQYIDDFLSGVLATILSTPCSAPFLGKAMAFAFLVPSTTSFVIFSFVGLGLSFPFILTAIFPSLVNWLPKPDAWMDKLKFILGLGMLATFLWLLDILLALIPQTHTFSILIMFFLIFSWIFIYQKVSKKLFTQLIMAFLILLMSSYLYKEKSLPLSSSDYKKIISEESESASSYLVWSEDKMMSYKDQNVFVDFTAKWCLTCQVNKKLVLNTQNFKNFVKRENIILMRADWTSYDANITNFLAKYSVVGVPHYFLKSKDGTIHPLGEIPRQSKIEEIIQSQK